MWSSSSAIVVKWKVGIYVGKWGCESGVSERGGVGCEEWGLRNDMLENDVLWWCQGWGGG